METQLIQALNWRYPSAEDKYAAAPKVRFPAGDLIKTV